MEYLDPDDGWQALLDFPGRIPPELLAALEKALQMAHGLGLAHGDWRDRNILCDRVQTACPQAQHEAIPHAAACSHLNLIDAHAWPHPFVGRQAAAALWHAGLCFDLTIKLYTCRTAGWEVRFIDMEWSGRDGEVTYPMFMNHATVDWPSGVASNMPAAHGAMHEGKDATSPLQYWLLAASLHGAQACSVAPVRIGDTVLSDYRSLTLQILKWSVSRAHVHRDGHQFMIECTMCLSSRQASAYMDIN
ncbi:hypothetical protein MMC07_005685 [Pseudocyphellaria aurata]|nr:hypothetical protein [Pseudocyphellaria aurata]